MGARTKIYGLFDEASDFYRFAGSSIAQLPPPWNDSSLSIDAISALLYENIPVWRALYALEADNVPQMEFTTPETIATATAVVGALMGPDWLPSKALRNRGPRSKQAMRDSRGYQP